MPKTLSDTTLEQLRTYLYQQMYDATMDDAHHFIRDALLDGYCFGGYRTMSQADAVRELLDELEVDDLSHLTPENLRDREPEFVTLVHKILTELE